MTLSPSWVTGPRKVSSTDATSIDQGNFNALMNSANTIWARVPPTYFDITADQWRMRALAMRLRIAEGSMMPFQHISTAYTGEQVFIFVVQNGEAVVLTDESSLFPSDTLITQLRLLA